VFTFVEISIFDPRDTGKKKSEKYMNKNIRCNILVVK
jgi:hypothetical protein